MEIKLKIRRYNPETGQLIWEEASVPFHQDLTVMEALDYLNDHKQKQISFRHSCRMGICGSCGAIVNNEHVLMCQTFCRDLKQPIVIEPIKNFPVIKDLVVDIKNGMEKFRTALPYTKIQSNHTSEKSGYKHLLQSPTQRKKIEQSSQCIKCMLCYSACPIFAFNQNFIGPAAAALADRYNKDNRDHLKESRFREITKDEGIYKCSFIGECSKVCPKSVDPSGTLQKLKIAGVFKSPRKSIPQKNK